MPRVMFSISYAITADHRDRYLGLIREMKQHLASAGKKNYTVYEAKGKKNTFTEVFLTDSVEEFDALEDNQDERTQELVSKIEECVDTKGMKYSTLVEMTI
jgi:L-rhamnose mutarotase